MAEDEKQPEQQEQLERPEEESQAPVEPEAAPEASEEDQPPDQQEAEAQPAEGEAQPAEKGAKKKDEPPPGAELDPIAIEPERELSAEERARLEAEAEERARLEAEMTAERPEEPVPAPTKPAELKGDARYIATGKRKRSVARVVITPGSGSIEVNRRKLNEYFPRVALQTEARQPLSQTGYEDTVDVKVRVHGGGVSGQATAVSHGIARALCEVDPGLRQELKRRGMLTRDARVKERRKAGLKKARKRPQFSKR
jgi:small subunit ribosomal protein S9